MAQIGVHLRTLSQN